MNSKFDKLYNLFLEAAPPSPPDEEEEDDLNFDAAGEEDTEDDSLGDQDLDVEEPMAQEPDTSTPQDIELATLAVQALYTSLDASDYNVKIYDDFEERGNTQSILNYVENIVKKSSPDHQKIGDMFGEEGVDTEQLKGKNIAQRLSYYDNTLEDSEPVTPTETWARIILNALKYKSNNYDLPDVTPETVTQILAKLKTDFTYDTRGMMNGMVKDRPTGSSMPKGPGVF